MGYLKIPNLYKDQTILLFKEAYALEKIHGTSAHVSLKKTGELGFFSGGANHESFVALFDQEVLLEKARLVGTPFVVFGEAYGGKMMRMSKTYGPSLRFVAFDVRIGDCWLNVPKAEAFVNELGIDFVPWVKVKIDNTEQLDALRDTMSVQAKKVGIEESCPREGIVLRPLEELTQNNGERVIAKHKSEMFQETRTPREVTDPEKLEQLKKANAIADEWVTEMRLTHVLDKLPDATAMEDTRLVVVAMIEDVIVEAGDEIVDSREARKAIGKRAAKLFHARLRASLGETKG